jgi:NTE family protein
VTGEPTDGPAAGSAARAGDTGPANVAIACQGGGSHTAFTAGVLKRLLREWDRDRHRLVGISGTSGGAFDALAVWYGLVTADEERAVALLDDLWTDLAADDPVDRVANGLAVWGQWAENTGVPVPRVTPYALPGGYWGQSRVRRTLERRIDFDAIPDLCAGEHPRLVVGTVDVEGGVFETFVDEAVTAEAVLASAAVPSLFPGVRLHGHVHWDGLFSQNPPITDLLRVDADRKPDEIWVIQVNPQVREGTPRSLVQIADRRNELSGNLSLNQEVRFVERVNDWIEEGALAKEGFSVVDVRRIEIDREYGHATKLDRTPAFLDELMDLGEERAGDFLARLDAERASDVAPVDGPVE